MKFRTRKWVKPEDLNPNGTLFGGRLLEWIDEEAALFSIYQFENQKVITKYISEINFVNSAQPGDIIEIGMDVVSIANTFITLKCIVRNIMTLKEIIVIDKIVMVNLSESGRPKAHGLKEPRL